MSIVFSQVQRLALSVVAPLSRRTGLAGDWGNIWPELNRSFPNPSEPILIVNNVEGKELT